MKHNEFMMHYKIIYEHIVSFEEEYESPISIQERHNIVETYFDALKEGFIFYFKPKDKPDPRDIWFSKIKLSSSK